MKSIHKHFFVCLPLWLDVVSLCFFHSWWKEISTVYQSKWKGRKTVLLLKYTLFIFLLNCVNQINWLNSLCISDFNFFLHLHISNSSLSSTSPLHRESAHQTENDLLKYYSALINTGFSNLHLPCESHISVYSIPYVYDGGSHPLA